MSSAVAVVVQVCFWVALGMGAACLWFPLTDITKVPPPNPPVLFVQLIGFLTVLPLAGLVAALLERRKGRSPLRWLLTSVHWGLLAIAAFALYRRGFELGGWPRVELIVGLVLFVLLVLGSPVLAAVVSGWRRGQRASGTAFALALIVCPLAALPWLVVKLFPRVRVARKAVAFALALQCIALEVVLIAAAAVGVKSFAWPVLIAGDAMSTPGIVSVVAIAIGIIAILAGLVQRLMGRRVRTPLELGAASLAIGVACTVAGLFFYGVREVGENLQFVGGWNNYTPPMGLIIPAIVAAAIAILALVLLVVRFFFTFFTTVSIGGVTIGTMALVIVLSVMSGFETDLREKILGFNAHIQVSKTNDLQFESYQQVEKVLEEMDDVVGYTPFLITEAYMSNHNNYGNVTLKGIDPDRVAGVTEIVHNLEKGDEHALAKIWPLAEDGSILGRPDDLAIDSDDDDDVLLDEGPVDFSGGLEEVDEEELELMELDLGPPIDFSGGLETYEEPDAGIAEAPDLDGGILDEELPGQGADELQTLDEWTSESFEHDDYISPDIAVLDGLLVGRELANQIHLFTDQEVRVISPLPDVSPDGLSIPRMKNYRIAGRFFSGMYEYDLKYVYTSLSSLQSFLDLGDVVNGIEVRVRDPRSTGAIVKQLEESLGPEYRVQDWKELNRALFSALKLEKIAMFFILVIIVLVASFSIIGNLIMVVIEKAKEIAILKTLGSSDAGVMKIFITQGFFIGLVGTSLGVALGLGACYLGKTFGVPLDPDVYYIDKLPIQVEFASVAAVGLAGLVISVVATLYPAYLAARMRPVKGLRWNS